MKETRLVIHIRYRFATYMAVASAIQKLVQMGFEVIDVVEADDDP